MSGSQPHKQEERILLAVIRDECSEEEPADPDDLYVDGWPKCKVKQVLGRLLGRGVVLKYPNGVLPLEVVSKKQ